MVRTRMMLNFFKKVHKEVLQTQLNTILIAGDFNVPLDRNKDTTAKFDSHVKCRRVIEAIMEDLELWDVWRNKNDIQKYTWFKFHPTPVYSRLDYALVSGDIMMSTEEVQIGNRCRTDHCLFWLKWNEEGEARGRGLWKLNNLHLCRFDQ